MYLSVDLSVCMFYPKKPEEGVRFPGAGVETVVSCLRWMLAIKLALGQLRSALWLCVISVLSKSRETVTALVTFFL